MGIIYSKEQHMQCTFFTLQISPSGHQCTGTCNRNQTFCRIINYIDIILEC